MEESEKRGYSDGVTERESMNVGDMKRDVEIGSELTTSLNLCPVSGSFPIQFRVLFVLSGHHSILRVIRFCCLQQCLDGE